MQDMPPPPIRITIPAGVKPGGAVFVRQASTGANYLVSVPESLLPVRTPPPRRSVSSPPSHPRHPPAAGRHLLLRAADAARGARAIDAARHRARLLAERRLRTPGAPEQRVRTRAASHACACNAPAIARHRTYVSHDTDTRIRTSDRERRASSLDGLQISVTSPLARWRLRPETCRACRLQDATGPQRGWRRRWRRPTRTRIGSTVTLRRHGTNSTHSLRLSQARLHERSHSLLIPATFLATICLRTPAAASAAAAAALSPPPPPPSRRPWRGAPPPSPPTRPLRLRRRDLLRALSLGATDAASSSTPPPPRRRRPSRRVRRNLGGQGGGRRFDGGLGAAGAGSAGAGAASSFFSFFGGGAPTARARASPPPSSSPSPPLAAASASLVGAFSPSAPPPVRLRLLARRLRRLLRHRRLLSRQDDRGGALCGVERRFAGAGAAGRALLRPQAVGVALVAACHLRARRGTAARCGDGDKLAILLLSKV